MTSMILIPLQKVFDTIDHYIILLKNMSTIGFSKYTIGWFKSFVLSKFRKRIQNLQILRVDAILVHSGTFTISLYVNDIPQAVKSNLFLYADDSCFVF